MAYCQSFHSSVREFLDNYLRYHACKDRDFQKEPEMKKIRFYLVGISESAWENLQPLMAQRYPTATVAFECTLQRSVRLVISLISEIEEESDPKFFNNLRIHKHIAWWEYADAHSHVVPTTRWLSPSTERRRELKSG